MDDATQQNAALVEEAAAATESLQEQAATLARPWTAGRRSLLYRHLWRHGRSLSVGYARDRASAAHTVNRALTVKMQWEV
jgi:hypothetical protein